MFKLVIAAALLAVSVVLVVPAETNAAGAFAMGRNDKGGIWYGLQYNSDSVAEARRGAMRRCREEANGGACNVVTTFWNKCFAFAWQVGNHNGYGWATRDTLEAAIGAAVSSCQSHGLPCEIKAQRCDETGQ
jgi:hypothetical protein